MNIEQYTGDGFKINQEDNCTNTAIDNTPSTYSFVNKMKTWQSELKDMNGTDDTITVSDTEVSGYGSFKKGLLSTLSLKAPGENKTGSIKVEYEVPAWLKYDWQTENAAPEDLYEENPSAIATFGIYRGNDRIISWREVGF